MDPFGDLFSFINTNDLKKKKEVHNIHKKTDKTFEVQKLKLTKNNKICKLCEEGEVHEQCTVVQKYKRKGQNNDGKHVCDKCEYTSDIKILLRFHIEAVHLKIKCYRCSVCDYASYQIHSLKIHVKSKHMKSAE